MRSQISVVMSISLSLKVEKKVHVYIFLLPKFTIEDIKSNKMSHI